MNIIRIDNTDVFLQNMEKGQGKITISDTYGHNYSYYWGSMGDTLEDFIHRIDSCYFTKNLLGSEDSYVIDVKKTFRNVRRHIREEIRLKWYMHVEFQKEMREQLNSFQEDIEETQSERHFVDMFYKFIKDLPFYDIGDRYDSKRIEEDFNSISEPWYFIERKPSPEYEWLCKFHKKLKKELCKQPKLQPA